MDDEGDWQALEGQALAVPKRFGGRADGGPPAPFAEEVAEQPKPRIARPSPKINAVPRRASANRVSGSKPGSRTGGQSSDLRKRRTLRVSSVNPSAARASICGHSTSRPTPLRNVPRMTTR